MAFPVIETTAETIFDTAVDPWTVNLPSGIASGNLLLVLVRSSSANQPTVTWPAGYTEFFNSVADASNDTTAMAYRQADGTEGATISVDWSGTTKGAALAWRISGAINPATQVPEITSATGTSTTPDPPSLTPTGGAKDYLWLALSGIEGEQTLPPTFPTDYGLNQIDSESGVGGAIATNCRIAGAGRQLNATSQDPGTYTWSVSDDWTAMTVAVHPAAGATFNETPSMTLVILPDNAALLSAINFPSATAVITPEALGILSALDAPQVGPLILTPASQALLSADERRAVSFQIIPADLDRLTALDAPQVGPIVLVPASRDTASFVDRPQVGPIVILPFSSDNMGAQVFTETVQAILTILPAVLARLSVSETRQVGPIVVSPSSADLLLMFERPSATVLITPAASATAAFIDRTSATTVFVVTDTDRLTGIERPQVGPIIFFPFASDSTGAQVFTETVQSILTILPSLRALLTGFDRPQVGPVILLPSVVDTRAFVETVQIGPIILSPFESDLRILTERPQATSIIVPAVRDMATFVDRPQATAIIVPSALGIASFVERPQTIVIILPSETDSVVSGAGIFETVTAILNILASAADVFVPGPFHSAGGRRVTVSGRPFVVMVSPIRSRRQVV